jgi:hypothetical protein
MLEQDTYYYGTGRVIDALDFYLDSVQPPSNRRRHVVRQSVMHTIAQL